MTMPERKIGPFTVSAVGLGCMNLSHGYGEKPADADSVRLLNRALDLGYSVLDTAAIYGDGANERLVGQVMHRRSEFTLASKCMLDCVDGKRVLDGRPESITRTLDAALQRLGTDIIDLYYLHRLDKSVPIEESVGALSLAVEAGKIRTIGLSEMSAATIRRAQEVHPITAVQTEYSPWVRNPEVAVLQTCRELGIGFVAFSPVARGFLAGAVSEAKWLPDDIRAGMPRFNEPSLAHNLAIFRRFAAIADDAGVSPAQLSLGWVLSRGDDVVPIPGTRSLDHLAENLIAADFDYPPEVFEDIDALFAPGAVHGARYAPGMQAMIDTELLPEELA